MTTRAAIAVFVKYPDPGRVKTRLAKELGDLKAAKLYAAMISEILVHTLRPLSRAEFEVVLMCDPFRSLETYRSYFFGNPFRIEMQCGNDLGERLINTFQTLYSEYSKVIAIGTDCVQLTPAHIVEAKEQLWNGADVVIGPTKDGGYYLIGTKKFEPRLFKDIAWSTPGVFAQTLERIEKLRLTVSRLSMLEDIDTVGDLPLSLLVEGD